MNVAFGSEPIGLQEWGLIIGCSFVIFIVIGFEKWIRHRELVSIPQGRFT